MRKLATYPDTIIEEIQDVDMRSVVVLHGAKAGAGGVVAVP